MNLKNNLKDNWKQIVKTVAPALGTALGGPMAGTAIKVLAESLLGTTQATEAEVEAAILSASPEQLVQLRQIDKDFEVRMRELGIKLEEIQFQDRDSARDLAKYNMWPQIILSTIYTVGYIYILVQFLSGGVEISQSLKTEFNIVLGVLTAGMANIMQFWFGSSSGSKQKTAVVEAGRR